MGEHKRKRDHTPSDAASMRDLQDNTPPEIEIARAELMEKIKPPHCYALIHWINGGHGMMLSSNMTDDSVISALDNLVKQYKNVAFMPIYKHNH
jgi:hypothetical protein